MKRRDLIQTLFAFIPLTLGFLGITHMGMKFITPSRKKGLFRKVYVSNLTELPLKSTKTVKDLRGKDLLIVRTGDKEVKALSTVCTHLGCKVHWEKDNNRFFCPCHSAVFDTDGKVVSGPPPRNLDTYEVEVEGESIYLYFKETEI